MPFAAKKPCRALGCRALVNAGFCDRHADQDRRKVIDRERGTAASRGYDYRWQQNRKRFLADHPLCVMCDVNGLVVVATVVDHIIPHKGNAELFNDASNWQALCKCCHDRKTATQDSLFAMH